MKKDLENTFQKLAYREITIAKFEITSFLYHFFKDKERINIDLLIAILKREFPEYEGFVDYCLHYLLVCDRIVLVSKRSVYGYDLDHFNFLNFYKYVCENRYEIFCICLIEIGKVIDFTEKISEELI